MRKRLTMDYSLTRLPQEMMLLASQWQEMLAWMLYSYIAYKFWISSESFQYPKEEDASKGAKKMKDNTLFSPSSTRKLRKKEYIRYFISSHHKD